MSLELVLAEFDALKPAFVLDDSQETKNITADVIQNTVIKALNEYVNDLRSSERLVTSIDICWPGMAGLKMVEGYIKYQKLVQLLEKQGFDKSGSKQVGEYHINVCVFEDDLSLSVTKPGEFDLQEAHNKLKAKLPEIKPKSYEFRHDDVKNASEIGMPAFYKANLLKDQNQIEKHIEAAKHNFGYALLQENIENINELKAKINSPRISKTVKKEATIDLAARYLTRNFSAEELQRKDFPQYVVGLVEQVIDERAKENEKKFDISERTNLCLQLIKYVGGVSVYQNHKTMWQNTASWTPESLDKVITNLRNLAPVFESI
jgi:hypothetical protein